MMQQAGERGRDRASGEAECLRWSRAYRRMLTVRFFEEAVNELYLSGEMPGLAHLCIGQEAVAVGVCEALRIDDYITSTHRGHGHCLAKGAAVDRMFAELLGRKDGYCGGKGGSMHIADPETGNLGANAIVAGSAAIATGAALSAKLRGTGQVAVCFFSDGALGQGVLYEAMNMAALWRLPVLYVCEDNLYGEFTHVSEAVAGDVLQRPLAFGLSAEEIDGQDVRAVHAGAARAVARAREGAGPSFLHCSTYRFLGHHVGDVDRPYRSRDEEHGWRRHDPLLRLAEWLEQEGCAGPERWAELEREVRAEIEAGLRFARESPLPTAADVERHVVA
jgi:TPP-dependent pyruvate/acetoin dehydrogenase alpha subunit